VKIASFHSPNVNVVVVLWAWPIHFQQPQVVRPAKTDCRKGGTHQRETSMIVERFVDVAGADLHAGSFGVACGFDVVFEDVIPHGIRKLPSPHVTVYRL
jgi:hypothetical protein